MSEAPDPRQIEELLLGGELRFTRVDAVKLAGVPEEFAQRLWRALGFPHLPDDTVAFTEGDVAALVKVAELRRAGILDEDIVLRMVRAVGQTMARLAKWQIDILVGALTDPLEPPDPETVQFILENAESHIADLEPLLVHAWRRQLSAAGTRALAASDDTSPGRVQAAVGFADMVAFTQTSRDLDERALAQLVERFEETASDVIAEHGGRLVKTLGDEVLFSAETPGLGAEIGLCVAEAVRADGEIPDVRVGMAYGPVLPLMGDVFGTTVNLASRLTAMARPGTALVDAGLAAELRGDGAYELARIARRRARGLGVVQPYVLRRSARSY
ncbi:MAG: adenylate/guanylate cyclase [Actinoallomurus sp.]|nr:adenylate/guanylate cyclase [Actinoallomurus sp.]